MKAKLTATIAALGAAAALSFAAPASAAVSSPADCDLVAAPTGSDSAAGTAAAPLRSAEALAKALTDGDTGCFRSGSYSFNGLSIRAPHSTITTYPGDQRATLQGHLRLERSATGAVVENLFLDGRNWPDQNLGPLIYADQVVLRDNEITNYHTTNCVHLAHYYDEPAPTGVVIENNNIHDCGQLPAMNHEHGIYVAAARDLTIRDNLIWNNADRGIQLYTDVSGSHIYGNVINGNGTGIIFGGNEEAAASDNVVENNIITNSNVRFNVEYSYDPAVQGSGNVVRRNCIHGAEGYYGDAENGAAISEQVGFTATDNVIADPQFADAAHGDFTLAPGSPCSGILDGTSAPPTGQISLEAARRAVPAGSTASLRGSLPTGVTGKVWILRSNHGNWQQVRGVKVHGSRFAVKTRITDRTKFKARAAGAKDSRAVKVAARGARKS